MLVSVRLGFFLQRKTLTDKSLRKKNHAETFCSNIFMLEQNILEQYIYNFIYFWSSNIYIYFKYIFFSIFFFFAATAPRSLAHLSRLAARTFLNLPGSSLYDVIDAIVYPDELKHYLKYTQQVGYSIHKSLL